MQTVTDAFKTAIDANVRTTKAKVIVEWVGNYISGDATASASGTKDAVNTPASQAINGKVNPYRKWALADSTKPDGTFYACPSDGEREMGWHNDVASQETPNEAYGSNLVENFSFENYEEGTPHDDFAKWDEWSSAATLTFQADESNYHEGSVGVKITASAAFEHGWMISDYIEVNENLHYELYSWWKELSGTSTIKFGYMCYDQNKNNIPGAGLFKNAYQVSTSWEQVGGVIHPSSESGEAFKFEQGTKYIRIHCWHQMNIAEVALDEVTLRPQVSGYGFDSAPWLQIDFDAPKTIGNLVLAFEQLLNHYAKNFTISYYDGSWHDLTIVANEQTFIELEVDPPKANVTKLKLTIFSVNLADSYAKVVEFGGGFSEEFNVDDIDTLRILKERQFSEGSLPIGNASANSLDLILNNTENDFFPQNIHSPYHTLFKDNRRIHAYLGVVLPDESVEWLKQGVFYSGDWKCPDNSPTASASAMDRAKLLMQSQFSTSIVYQGQTISYLVEVVLADAGLDTSEYQIDTISTTIPYAWFEPMTHWQALKQLAECCCANIYFDEDGIFRFESKEHLAGHTTSQTTISDSVNLISCDNPFAYSEVRNYIEVISKPLIPDVEQEIYNMQEEQFDLGAGDYKYLTLFFSKTPCIDVQTPVFDYSGGTVIIKSWTAYAWGGDIVLQNLSNTLATITEITVDGKPLIDTGEIRAISKDDVLVTEQGAKKYTLTNNFIQSLSFAQEIANFILATYKAPEKDVDAEVRGNFALQLGDRITVVNAQNSINADYWILKDELTFNGTLSGKLLGRKVT